MNPENDTYQTIYNALKHPLRRKILRILNNGKTSYTEIQTKLNIDNGLLNYHLDNMRDLLAKDDAGIYSLSESGQGAVTLITRVEDTDSHRDKVFGLTRSQTKSLLLLLIIVTGASLLGLGYLFTTRNSLDRTIAKASRGALSQLDHGLGSLSNAFLDVVNSGEITRDDLHSIRDEADEVERLSDLLVVLDSDYKGYWRQYSSLAGKIYSFMIYLESDVYDLGVVPKDSLVLTEMQVELFSEMWGLCHDVSFVSREGVMDTGVGFGLDESVMAESLGAVTDFSDLINDGYSLFSIG